MSTSFEPTLWPLLLNTSLFIQVAQDVIHVKSLICPQFTNVVVYGYQSRYEFASITAELMERANFSIQLNSNLRLHTDKCVIVFTEQPDATSIQAVNVQSPFRGIVVTSRSALKLLTSYMRYTLVYVIFDDNKNRFGFYNRFRRQFSQMDRLESDPIAEAQHNLNGFIRRVFTTKNENHIFQTAADRHNGTFRIGMTPEIATVLTHFDIPVRDQATNLLFLSTTVILCFLVPRSKAKPLITILSDPFDEASWIVYFVSAMVIAMFEVLLSNRRRHLLLGIKKLVYLLWMALTGSDIRIDHEVSRWTTAIWLLMNVILVSAYQSLIISFLQQPRYYSEFKTLQQMNQSCCWARSYTADLASYDLYQNFPCEERLDFFRIEPHEHEKQNYCLLEICDMLEAFLEGIPDIAQFYRLDRRSASSFYPTILNVKFSSPIYEVLQFYVSVFAESDLLRDERAKTARAMFSAAHLDHGVVQAISVEDLSLAGIVLGAGALIGGLSFVLECTFRKFRHSKVVERGTLFLRKVRLI